MTAGPQPSVFVTAFDPVEGAGPALGAVHRLGVPDGERGNTVLAAVQIKSGVDYFASCLTARPLKLTTPDGVLHIDGRFGFVRLLGGKPVLGRLVDGRKLAWNGKPVPGTILSSSNPVHR